MFQTVRGTFDVLPDAQESGGSFIPGSPAWRHVETVVRDVMARFGFEEIRTPVLEPLALIARGVGATTDIVQKEMFVVPRGDEDYVLRPEVTAPTMRAYLQHRLDQRGGAQRFYYIGPCFRAERPQKGRFRQFHQFGIELLGADTPLADAEAIACLRAVYEAFKITETRLRINSLGDAETRPAYREALQAYFEPFRDRLSETSRQRLDANPLRILDTKSDDERRLLADAPRLGDFMGESAKAHFDAVKGYLDRLGIPYVEDPLLVRGLDYYTGIVFELESDALGAQSALAAGGRYDGLAESVGSKQAVPAVGWAAGIERLFLALQDADHPFPEAERPDAFLVALGEEAQAWAFKEAQRLRNAGYSIGIDLMGRSMKSQMKEANRQRARNAIIIGQDEIDRREVSIKNLDQSIQKEASMEIFKGSINPGTNIREKIVVEKVDNENVLIRIDGGRLQFHANEYEVPSIISAIYSNDDIDSYDMSDETRAYVSLYKSEFDRARVYYDRFLKTINPRIAAPLSTGMRAIFHYETGSYVQGSLDSQDSIQADMSGLDENQRAEVERLRRRFSYDIMLK